MAAGGACPGCPGPSKVKARGIAIPGARNFAAAVATGSS